MRFNSKEIFDAGYAILQFDIVNTRQTFKFCDEEISFQCEEHDRLSVHEVNGWPVLVAKIDEVRARAPKP